MGQGTILWVQSPVDGHKAHLGTREPDLEGRGNTGQVPCRVAWLCGPGLSSQHYLPKAITRQGGRSGTSVTKFRKAWPISTKK